MYFAESHVYTGSVMGDAPCVPAHAVLGLQHFCRQSLGTVGSQYTFGAGPVMYVSAVMHWDANTAQEVRGRQHLSRHCIILSV